MLKIFNPSTDKLITEVETDTPESVVSKFELAKKAQKIWAKVSLDEKIEFITKFRDLTIKNKDKLAKILTSEVGKPINQSINELNGLVGRIDFFIENVKKTLENESILVDKNQHLEESISHEPLGVICNISAWNYPYFVASNVFIPALLTGNSVLYKPSEFATLTGLEIANLLYEAGIPKDIFITIIGDGKIGASLLEQNLNGIFFTGSYPTGKKISELASKKFMKVQLELGGKDPVYICDDVDVKSVAEAVADGAFYNNGQSCCAVERIYVNSKIYDTFVEHFLDAVKGFVIGDPMDSKTYIGALTRKELQITALEKQVEDAIKKGAKLLTGGKRFEHEGFYFEPTVFVNVNHDMELMKEESFGPIIGIQKVNDDDEAISLMNDTEYGLTSSVYSSSKERSKNILSQMNSGTVYWNCCDRISPRLPWSGRKNSGIGSTLSTYGIQAFVQPKAWHLKG
ncbi:MAG: aldehyde dehydrogenase family protein [Cyanobacteriota bacterium]